MQLKEDLALERDEAIEEKERLNKAVVRCCTIKHLSDIFIRPKSPSLDFNTLSLVLIVLMIHWAKISLDSLPGFNVVMIRKYFTLCHLIYTSSTRR